MQGQYKSTVQCAECKHKKATFDAFTTVQLPIPYQIKVEFYYLSRKPMDPTFMSEVELDSLQTDEPLMNIK